jgi:predicted nucleic acid-binding protein
MKSGSSCETPTGSLARRTRDWSVWRGGVVSLDSSFLIDLLAGEIRAVTKARELDQSTESRYITAPAAAEVMIGAYRVGGVYFDRTKLLIDGLPLLNFDREAYQKAGQLGAEMSKRGSPIGQGDLFIAAISLRHGERVLSNDRSFSRIPGLSVETY